MLIDTHCHLDYILAGQHGHDPAPKLDAVLLRAREKGVHRLLNPSVCLTNWDAVLALSAQSSSVFVALGIHPTEVALTREHPDWLERLRLLAQNVKVRAIGETGLDFYWHADDAEHQALQRECFLQQMRLAKALGLPVIVHDRDAHEAIAACVDMVPGVQGVMHCFSGDAEFATTMLDKGFYISFAGNVTFKKAEALREAARRVPLDCLLVETDSPYLSPVPERGKPNEPYRTYYVAECLAAVKGISLEELAAATTANAERLFGLPSLENTHALA